jgi:hypothetical protein
MLHGDKYTFMIISRSVLLRMKNISDNSCRKNENTLVTGNTFFFFFENRAVYDITCKNTVETGRPHMTIWRTAFRIPKATNTHPECVILYTFLLQQCLHEHASMLRYTYTACLGFIRFFIRTHTNISRHN